jgi:hypothetical protein
MAGDAQSERRRRLAEALRANLRRRKTQQRERSADPSGTAEAERQSNEEPR